MNYSKKNDKLIGQNEQVRKPKKNPKADVTRNESIYFAVGLLVMLGVSYLSINYKSYEKSNIDIGMVDIYEDDEINIELIKPEVLPLPTPPPAKIPKEIEVIEDEIDVIETEILSTETNEDDIILDIPDIDVEEVPEEVDVPFAFIENVPVFPGCEKGDNDAKRKCMSAKISKFVQKKFNVELAEELGLTGRQTIRVLFKIDKNGNIAGVQARAPHPRLQKEAARVINLLPKMKPGIQRDKPVTVSYSLPIIFQVQD